MFRRLIALFLLIAVTGSAMESVMGVLRDGEIHHETEALAAQHASASAGEHGHEDVSAPSHQHGGEHQHGTATDHCTHQHGTAAATSVAFALAADVSVRLSTEPSGHTDSSPTTLFHPPRT